MRVVFWSVPLVKKNDVLIFSFDLRSFNYIYDCGFSC